MGRWDYQAIEMLEGEPPLDAMRVLYEAQRTVDRFTIDHHFRAYHTFHHNGKRYLHLGWDSCNSLAYQVLKSLHPERAIISTYSSTGFARYEDTLNAHKLFSTEVGESFDPPITFDDVVTSL